MFTRRRAAGGLLAGGLVGWAAPALATSPPPAPDLAATLGLPAGDGPFLLPTGLDPAQRLTVEVYIDGAGPFAFVVDTGSDRSVISEEIAARLGLHRGADILLHAVDGSAIMPTARVGLLKAGAARLRNGELTIASAGRVGADGLLGVDILQGHNVVMDFQRRRLEIRGRGPVNVLGRPPGEVSVNADEKFGRLAVVDATVGGVRTLAFIDSGSGVSIGNLALAQAMDRRQRRPDPRMAVRMLGVIGRETFGEVRIVRTIRMGPVTFTNSPMVFTDVHIFDHWGLNARPAALLGVDVLRGFARVQLDFGAGRLRFLLGHGMAAPVMQA